MATNPQTILTTIHGKEIGLNHERKLVVKEGYVIEGTPGSILQFDDDGIAQEVFKAYAQLSDTTNQVPVSTAATLVVHNTIESISGITHSMGVTTIETPGVYGFIIGAQIGKASGAAQRSLSIWIRKNGVDVPRSGATQGITNLDTSVLINNQILSVEAGDEMAIYMSTPDTSGGIGLYVSTATNGPVIPSIITSIVKLR